MKRYKDNIILIILLFAFVMMFKYSSIFKASILSSISLWFNNLVPSMLPIYFLIDLALNYGLSNVLFKIFKSNSILLIFISLISGTPGNTKYIKEFYKKGLITKNAANLLLACSYSPNPLFIFAISKDVKSALIILGYIYATNILLYLIFNRREVVPTKCTMIKDKLSFIDCLSSSIKKSFDVLILILGIVVFFGLINTLLSILHIDSYLLCSILELTNAISIINTKDYHILKILFAVSFGGLSIHAQIKSILESTDLSYRYFLYGRLISSLPFFFSFIF